MHLRGAGGAAGATTTCAGAEERPSAGDTASGWRGGATHGPAVVGCREDSDVGDNAEAARTALLLR